MTTPQPSTATRGHSDRVRPDDSGVRESMAEIDSSLGAFVNRGKLLRQRSTETIIEAKRRQSQDDQIRTK